MQTNPAERIERLKSLYKFWMEQSDIYREEASRVAQVNRALIKKLNKCKRGLK